MCHCWQQILEQWRFIYNSRNSMCHCWRKIGKAFLFIQSTTVEIQCVIVDSTTSSISSQIYNSRNSMCHCWRWAQHCNPIGSTTVEIQCVIVDFTFCMGIVLISTTVEIQCVIVDVSKTRWLDIIYNSRNSMCHCWQRYKQNILQHLQQ